MRFSRKIAAVLCLFAVPLRAQDLALFVGASGTVFWYNPSGQVSNPCKQWPVRLRHVDSAGFQETRTDSYGAYAFYGLPKGAYELEIPRDFGRVFRKKVELPARLEPIVLPPRLPALKNNADTIRVESNYETLSPGRYKFRLWTKVPKEWKPLVKRVRYGMNHPSFTNKNLIGQNAGQDFAAEYTGWGCLATVAVEVEFADDTWNVEFPFCANLRQKAQARKKAQPAVK